MSFTSSVWKPVIMSGETQDFTALASKGTQGYSKCRTAEFGQGLC